MNGDIVEATTKTKRPSYSGQLPAVDRLRMARVLLPRGAPECEMITRILRGLVPKVRRDTNRTLADSIPKAAVRKP